MKVIEILLKEILEDFFFCFTSPSEHTNLKRSIQESGILTPIQVIPMEGKYRLISGFRRFHVARELDLSHVPVMVKPESLSIEKAFRFVLLEKVICRMFNLIEKARVLHILEGLQVPFELMEKDFLPILEIPAQFKTIDEIKCILKYSISVQHYVEMYNLSLKQTRMFNPLTIHQQELLVDMAMKLQVRSVELSEIISMLIDISGRENLTVEVVLNQLEIGRIMDNRDDSKHEKLFKIKERLMDRRYPKLASWNRSLVHLSKAILLPEQVKLKWDRSLEKPGVELRVKIRTADDLKCIDKILSNKENLDRFEEMFKIV
ncbi:ParB N-terminal domain-containing protein [bacterium]|nr:ParB N-terminal domain-containing protein [bacterium]RQV98552.1 MAG: hypothetical protein EH221_01755 [bacterium]